MKVNYENNMIRLDGGLYLSGASVENVPGVFTLDGATIRFKYPVQGVITQGQLLGLKAAYVTRKNSLSAINTPQAIEEKALLTELIQQIDDVLAQI